MILDCLLFSSILFNTFFMQECPGVGRIQHFTLQRTEEVLGSATWAVELLICEAYTVDMTMFQNRTTEKY